MYQAVMSSWGSKQRTGTGSQEAVGWTWEADTLELGGAHQLCGYDSPSPALTSHHCKMVSGTGPLFAPGTQQARGCRRRGRFPPGGYLVPQLTRLCWEARGPGCCLRDKARDLGDFSQCRAGRKQARFYWEANSNGELVWPRGQSCGQGPSLPPSDCVTLGQ